MLENDIMCGEAVAWKTFQELRFPKIFADLGFCPTRVRQAALLIIGRLLHPASERKTAIWAREISALAEVLGANSRPLSNHALYRTADLLFRRRSGCS